LKTLKRPTNPKELILKAERALKKTPKKRYFSKFGFDLVQEKNSSYKKKKITGLFERHSNWLKDLRNQLN